MPFPVFICESPRSSRAIPLSAVNAPATGLDLLGASLTALAAVILSLFVLSRREAVLCRRTASELSRFQLAAEGSADLITIMTTSGRIEYANKAVVECTGYLREELH